MSSRSGDLDPGLASYLARSDGLDIDQINNLTNFQSGLLGISETSSDMKELLGHEATDPRAREAIDLFCYQIKKSIGGLTAALGGLDLLVFTGGMGEDAPKIRARICTGLEYLGLEVDTARNSTNAKLISSDASQVPVRVVQTDEAATIVSEVLAIEAAK